MSPAPQAAQLDVLSVVPHSEQNFPEADAPHFGHFVVVFSAAAVMRQKLATQTSL
jgi:hypothetical protein